jgi:hypothetical protein
MWRPVAAQIRFNVSANSFIHANVIDGVRTEYRGKIQA